MGTIGIGATHTILVTTHLTTTTLGVGAIILGIQDGMTLGTIVTVHTLDGV